MAFENLGLSEPIVHGAQRMGFAEPTPVQAQAIPAALGGRDVVASSQTGSGKTAAFALPVLSRLKDRGALRCLVLEPTRELAVQVDEAFRDYGFFSPLKSELIYGGVGYERQRAALRGSADILIATPGRLLELLGEAKQSLDHLEFLILDEVDRMLDMGFLPDVRRIINMCPAGRQTMLFSATMPSEISKLASWALRDPIYVEIGASRTPAESVSHAFYPVASSQKFQLLAELLERTHFHSVIVFTRTKVGADLIANRLKAEDHSVAVLHSDRTQKERADALAGFKSGQYEVLVATDIASRGLDVSGVSHVINYDVPTHAEDYVHRIGRTGRAAATGDAFTLITAEDLDFVRAIERFIGKPVQRVKIEGFPYQFSTIFDEGAAERANKAAKMIGSRAAKRFPGRRGR